MCMTYSWYAKSGETKFRKKNLKSIFIQLELLDYLLKKNTNNISILLMFYSIYIKQ